MPKTIVAIEDDPQIAELLELLLESPDLTIKNYNSGREGLDAIRAQPPGLVLLDVKVPEMTGWEVLDALRAEDATQNIPVIMLSVSEPEPDRRPMFTRSQLNFYMHKPFDLLQLRRKIREILEISSWIVGESPTPPVKPGTAELHPIGDKLMEDQPKSPEAEKTEES